MAVEQGGVAIPGSKSLKQPEAVLESAIERTDHQCVIGDEFTTGPKHAATLRLQPSAFSLSGIDDGPHAAAFHERFFVFGLGVGIGHDPSAYLKTRAIPFDENRPDRDVEGAGSAPAEVADRTGVKAAPI